MVVRVTYASLSKADAIRRLRMASPRLRRKLPVSRMILFGSYAQDRHTVGSDIDVIVVYSGPERSDAYKIIIDAMGLPRLEPRMYTEEQFEALMKGSPKFADVLAKEGIPIDGGRKNGRKK